MKFYTMKVSMKSKVFSISFPENELEYANELYANVICPKYN